MSQQIFSNYPKGFLNGVTIRGLPVLQTYPGKVFYVNNSGVYPNGSFPGADAVGNIRSGSYARPFASLNFAASQCTAGEGDIIILMPGHAETISSSTALSLSTSGVAIVGLGTGNLRPTFTLNTANTTTIGIGSSNITIKNVLVVADYLAIAAAFTLTTAKDFTLENVEFRDTSAILNFIDVVKLSTSSNANDGLTISNCIFNGQATSGAVKLVDALGTHDRITIDSNYYSSLTTNAGAVIPIAAGKILTNLRVTNNHFNLVNATGTATGYLITTNGSTNSGWIDGNVDHSLPTSPLLITASSGFVYGANIHSDQPDLQGYPVPAADS
jgi:hypothetical protein